MDELLKDETTGGETEFFLATVTAWSDGKGAKIRLDGQDTTMSKYYKTICGAVTAGARVVVMKKSGTFVVLGKLGMESADSVEIITDVSKIFSSIKSGFSVSGATYVRYGKVAMFTALFTPDHAGTTSDWTTWATLAEGKRPAATVAGNCQATTFCIINTNGSIQFSRQYSSGFGHRVSGIYLLP